MFVLHGQCDARPTITFPGATHRHSLAGTKLYCLATEAHVHKEGTKDIQCKKNHALCESQRSSLRRCGWPDPYCTEIDWLHKNWERIVTAFGTFSALWHLLLCVFWLSMPFYFLNFVWPCLYATPFHMIQNVCFCIHCDTTVLFNVLNFVRNYTDTVCTVDCTRMKVTLPAKNMFTVIYSSAILTSHWL